LELAPELWRRRGARTLKSRRRKRNTKEARGGGAAGGDTEGNQKRVGRGKGEAPRRSYDRGGVRHLKEAPEAARVDREGRRRVGEEKPRVAFALDG